MSKVTCVYWVPNRFASPESRDRVPGECRRYPPTGRDRSDPMNFGGWPRTDPGDWCGAGRFPTSECGRLPAEGA